MGTGTIVVFGSNFTPRVFHLECGKDGDLRARNSTDSCFDHKAISQDVGVKRSHGMLYATETTRACSLRVLDLEGLCFSLLL